jgi:D-cysteine desulfhydrase
MAAERHDNGAFRVYEPAMSDLHAKEPPRLSLAHLPTPLVELKNLSREMGVPRVLMKRDDLTGLETTGNKVRKLEYVVADAVARGADVLVTHGGYQSNHCRATAAIGARLGLRVRLILRAPAETADPPKDGNLFLDHLFGADVSLHPPGEYAERKRELIDAAMAVERAAGRTPYFFPVGASIPLGCWGYVRCMSELAVQLGPDAAVDVFSSVSSAGTHVGLMLGRALLKLRNWRVIGVPVSDSVAFFQRDLRELERKTVASYGLEVGEADTPIHLIDGFIGEGYAIPYPAAIETTRLLARREGILLDPTYTAKGMTGMLETIRAGGVRPGAVPVFVHTGGAFGLLARRDLFL